MKKLLIILLILIITLNLAIAAPYGEELAKLTNERYYKIAECEDLQTTFLRTPHEKTKEHEKQIFVISKRNYENHKSIQYIDPIISSKDNNQKNYYFYQCVKPIYEEYDYKIADVWAKSTVYEAYDDLNENLASKYYDLIKNKLLEKRKYLLGINESLISCGHAIIDSWDGTYANKNQLDYTSCYTSYVKKLEKYSKLDSELSQILQDLDDEYYNQSKIDIADEPKDCSAEQKKAYEGTDDLGRFRHKMARESYMKQFGIGGFTSLVYAKCELANKMVNMQTQ